MAKILIAEDEQAINHLIKWNLELVGHTCAQVYDGTSALAAAEAGGYDLLILDVMLPGLSGFEILPRLQGLPVIFVTAKAGVADRLRGLQLGADDYITKPFDGKEMAARVRAVLRRSGGEEEGASEVSWPGLTVSLAEYDARFGGTRLEMPPRELELLYFLASHPNQVFTREQLLQQIWGYEYFGDSRTVDVHIKRLREKLTDSEKYGWSLYTVRGVGYKFATTR